MLLYSLLYLSGYDLTLDEIKHFRKWGSKTAGHPERGLAPGVEVTTGPLGQGFANGLGLAIAEAWLAARYNRPGHKIVDHYTYAICGDGDLMEGISQEAASLAGHLHLGKLIYLYDQNHISLAGATEIDFTEDVAKRFEASGWHTRMVPDGNDTQDVASAIREAQAEDQRPSLILARTHIGYGSPHKQDNFTAHGDRWEKTRWNISVRRFLMARKWRTSGGRRSTHTSGRFQRKPPSSRASLATSFRKTRTSISPNGSPPINRSQLARQAAKR